VLRRDAFLQVGGFRPLPFVFGEETLLAYDLAATGWQLCYVADVVAHHHPSPSRADPRRRNATQWRNALLTDWMRQPVPVAVRSAGAVVGASVRDPAARTALAQRAPLPAPLERQVEPLEATTSADA
jgi:GT2 family glycosyltransferase